MELRKIIGWIRAWNNFTLALSTVCPRSSDPFYTVTYYMKWFTTSLRHSTFVFILAVNKNELAEVI